MSNNVHHTSEHVQNHNTYFMNMLMAVEIDCSQTVVL